MKLYTKEQVNKKFKNFYINICKIYDYEKQKYFYEVRNVYKNIHENTTLGQDVGTNFEYQR